MTTEQVRSSIPLASTAAAVALTALETLKPPRDGAVGRELAIELAIVLVVAAITFRATGRATRVERGAGPSPRAALVLSIFGFLSVAAFALGVFSVVLAGGAALLALESRRRAGATRAGTVALAFAALTLPASLLIAVVS